MPLDPITGQVGPYSPQYLAAATNVAGGHSAPYKPGVLASMSLPEYTQPTSGNSNTGGGSGSGDGGAAAAQQAENQRQIDAINRMLGISSASKQSGLDRLNAGFNDKKASLASEQARTNQGYTDQELQNEQARTRGYEQVNNFANTSANNLRRVFQGANAGNSSVARQLAPHLVGKAAGERRTGVTQTAAENAQGIAGAREDADWQYKTANEDAFREKQAQEENFLRGINQQESDLLAKRQGFETAGGAANAATQAEIDQRFATLNSLFGQYAPTYSAKRMDFKKPELSKYSVDPAQIQLDQNAPAETRYYAPQLKKKQIGVA